MTARIFFRLFCGFLLLSAPGGCASFKHGNPRPAQHSPDGTADMSAKLREKSGARNAAPLAAPAMASTNEESAISASKAPYKLKQGDPIIIFLRYNGKSDKNTEQLEDIIDDQGALNLPLIGRMIAAGKTTSEFEQEIQKKYIDDQYYQPGTITVNVVTPQQYIFIRGEVRIPNKYQLVSGMTLAQAIASAGNFTEYADPRKAQLIRNGKTTTYDLTDIDKHPEKDIPLEAGDQLVIPRHWY